MTVDQLFRTARRAGLAAAVIGIPADAYHFTIASRAEVAQSMAFRLHGIALIVAFTLTLVALAGLVLAQRGRAGRLGAAGAGLALLGTTLVLGDLAKEAFALPLATEALREPQGYYLVVVVTSFALLTAGWTVTAAALRRTGLLSGPATALLVVGALLALPPIPGAYITLLIGIAVATQQLPARAADRAPLATTAA